MQKVKKTIRIIWATSGIVFFTWLVISTQSRGLPAGILQSDALISVSENSEKISFIPTENQKSIGVLFYPGALIDPKAYTPLARNLAENGFSVTIVKLPFRSANTAGQEAQLIEYTRQLMTTDQAIQDWVIAGHSRGGALATHLVKNNEGLFSGLILIGTSHPKESEFDLSTHELAVIKIYASNDGLASVTEIVENSVFLPNDTIWVEIAGGNHAQFGYYGTQLGDSSADISREEQQTITLSIILTFLNDLDQ